MYLLNKVQRNEPFFKNLLMNNVACQAEEYLYSSKITIGAATTRRQQVLFLFLKKLLQSLQCSL